jgi:hypothetical protein
MVMAVEIEMDSSHIKILRYYMVVERWCVAFSQVVPVYTSV